MKQFNEMDYLYASGRIRALEGHLLNRERAERMIDSRTQEDAFRVLSECGYDTPNLSSPEELEMLLAGERSRVFDTFSGIIPDRRIVDVFRVRYDTHNIKVLLKASVNSEDSSDLLLNCGRVNTEELTVMIKEMITRQLPPLMGKAVEEARDILARTSDSQLMDIALDKACLNDMLDLAKGVGSPFLTGYVRLIIDAANLRAFVRVKRMGKGMILLHHVLVAGGGIPVKQLASDPDGTALERLYARTLLKDAATVGAATALDLRCDNALMAYLHPARTLAFGAPLVVAYLAAKEAEITALRTIFTGRMAGLSPDRIRERIRDFYV